MERGERSNETEEREAMRQKRVFFEGRFFCSFSFPCFPLLRRRELARALSDAINHPVSTIDIQFFN